MRVTKHLPEAPALDTSAEAKRSRLERAAAELGMDADEYAALFAEDTTNDDSAARSRLESELPTREVPKLGPDFPGHYERCVERSV